MGCSVHHAPALSLGLATAADASVVHAAQKSGRDAFDDEKRRFREVARKLKLRRRGRTSALGDGLDDFTAGLTTADMSSSDSEAASGARLNHSVSLCSEEIVYQHELLPSSACNGTCA